MTYVHALTCHYLRTTTAGWISAFFTPYTEQDVLGRMVRMEQRSSLRARGVALDAFLLDDGWDDRPDAGYLARHSETVLAKVREKAGCQQLRWAMTFHRGLLLKTDVRVLACKEYGFETVDGKLALVGERTTLKTSMSGIIKLPNEHHLV